MKKKLMMALSLALVAVIAVAGTLAYLTDTDSDVNVMTLGNVDITQNEQQLADDGVTLEPFEQEKGIYPSTSVSKIVTVENTGKSDAYFRTLIAFEDLPDSQTFGVDFPISDGYTWSWGVPAATIVLDGVTYQVYEAVYKDVLKAGATSTPSLTKVEFAASCVNEDMAALGDTYDILVLSQAVQADGFADAQTALDTAFGKTADKAAEWFGGVLDENNGIPKDAVAVSSFEQLKIALAEGRNIKLTANISIPETLNVSESAAIYGQGHTITRADGYTGTVFSVKADSNLTIENITLDGSGATATGNLIATEGNGNIILNEGAVLQNNVGAHAVSLATRGGGSLTLNGAQIINNSSDSGAIWGGGAIIVNEGSKINGNSSTGSAGAIRMVGNCSLTVNGGEISNNTAAGDGGAIWGYGSSTYNFNGGVIANNKADGSGGAIWTGDSSVVNISGDFELSDNTASDAGALRLSNRTAFNMTGGKVSGNVSVNSDENDGFYGWNPAVNITGGELSDSILIQGGLTPTVGGNGITGIVNFDLTTNHYNINLANEFGTIKFTVNENDEHFINCNFKPADGYTYTEGDEAKLICMNEGYSTYWNASTETFCLQADN